MTTAKDKQPMRSMATSLSMPYTLTAGLAAGTYLAELAHHRVLGSVCPSCDEIVVPAQDYCASTGEAMTEFVSVPAEGVVEAVTTTPAGTVGLIRLTGAGTPLLHRILSAEVEAGAKVRAVWADEPQGNALDLAGFEPVAELDPAARPEPLPSPAEPLAERAYRLDLHYQHAYGPLYGVLFDELATSRRIIGSKCPSCQCVLVPPREFCEVCFARTAEYVDLPDTGVVQAYSIVHIEFVGQSRKPPYVYAEIVLDGAATRLIHTIGNIDPEEAKTRVRPGSRVQAVWRPDARSGTLDDVEYFELIDES